MYVVIMRHWLKSFVDVNSIMVLRKFCHSAYHVLITSYTFIANIKMRMWLEKEITDWKGDVWSNKVSSSYHNEFISILRKETKKLSMKHIWMEKSFFKEEYCSSFQIRIYAQGHNPLFFSRKVLHTKLDGIYSNFPWRVNIHIKENDVFITWI